MIPEAFISQAPAEPDPAIGVQNIIEGNGLEISLTGMTIVFTSLVLISVSIALLPRVLRLLSGILPPESGRHSHPGPPRSSSPGDELGRVAAIAMALHRRHRDGGGSSHS